MAKKKRHKTTATGYIEKISSQIFNKYQKEITGMVKRYVKNTKKSLPGLKKQFKNKLKKELETSFKLTPSSKIKKVKKAAKRRKSKR
jgi:hypothetical protein